METDDLQTEVLKFVNEHNLKTSVETRLLDLISEVGELSKEVLKGSEYGKKNFENTDEWEEEFGDILFCLICVANSTGINIETALKQALEKYKIRFRQKGDISSNDLS